MLNNDSKKYNKNLFQQELNNQSKINNLNKSEKQNNINKINSVEKSAVSRRNFAFVSTAVGLLMVAVSLSVNSSDLVKNQNLKKILVPVFKFMLVFGLGLFFISAVTFLMSQKHLNEVDAKLLNHYVEESKVNSLSNENISLSFNMTKGVNMNA